MKIKKMFLVVILAVFWLILANIAIAQIPKIEEDNLKSFEQKCWEKVLKDQIFLTDFIIEETAEDMSFRIICVYIKIIDVEKLLRSRTFNFCFTVSWEEADLSDFTKIIRLVSAQANDSELYNIGLARKVHIVRIRCKII